MICASTQVIRGTLQALVCDGRRITRSTFDSMIEKLLQYYGTGEGYTTEPLLKEMFKSLRSNNDGNRFGELVVGVVCDSDDSVPTILRNLGLVCRELRRISDKLNYDPNVYDIDFFSLAIDAGAEKPRGSVFAAARCMLSKILQQKKILTNSDYQRVHIGDSWDKDVLGAIDAGWHAIFVDRKRTKPDVPRLIDLRLPTLDEVFEEKSVVSVSSFKELVAWLVGRVGTQLCGPQSHFERPWGERHGRRKFYSRPDYARRHRAGGLYFRRQPARRHCAGRQYFRRQPPGRQPARRQPSR